MVRDWNCQWHTTRTDSFPSVTDYRTQLGSDNQGYRRRLECIMSNRAHAHVLPSESDLPFSLATAEQLMAIARNRVLSNSAHAPILPASWMTLHELTRLSEEVLEAKIADGTCLTVSRWSLNLPAPGGCATHHRHCINAQQRRLC